MNVKQLRESGTILFETLVGSHAYGTAIPTSDRDYRGVFRTPLLERISLTPPPSEVSEIIPMDVGFYDVGKFIDLAKDCNPNIIEYLFMPEDYVLITTPAWQLLVDNRAMFVSKKAYHTFSSYAYAQIKKARGENKWINNPKPEAPPQHQDFCWVIPIPADGCASIVPGYSIPYTMPMRPIPIGDMGQQINGEAFNLAHFHAAALEHVSNTYRLYYYGPHAKGVFRDGNLACESISLEDECMRFWGLLVYNDQEYQKAMLDHKNYWTWVKKRNPHRWVSQERGEVNYDVKNFQHCMRLLLSGKHILETGNPIIRFEGADLAFLRDIRAGKYSYDYLLEGVEQRMVALKALYDVSSLPYGPDTEGINKLYREIIMGDEHG